MGLGLGFGIWDWGEIWDLGGIGIWDLGWDGMGLGFGIWDYGILPIPTIWAASIVGSGVSGSMGHKLTTETGNIRMALIGVIGLALM